MGSATALSLVACRTMLSASDNRYNRFSQAPNHRSGSRRDPCWLIFQIIWNGFRSSSTAVRPVLICPSFNDLWFMIYSLNCINNISLHCSLTLHLRKAFCSLDNSWGCSPRGARPRTFSAQTHLFHRKIENLDICDAFNLQIMFLHC